jgi:hypothetical protein
MRYNDLVFTPSLSDEQAQFLQDTARMGYLDTYPKGSAILWDVSQYAKEQADREMDRFLAKVADMVAHWRLVAWLAGLRG